MTQTQIEKYEDGRVKEILIDGSDSQLERLRHVPIVLNKIFKNVLQKDVDYGTIPGTPKPSLWKPGAELLANYFSLVASDPVIESKIEDRSENPYFEYVIKQRFYRNGMLIGAGSGAANTRETRYAFRKVYDADYAKMSEADKALCISRKGSHYLATPPDEIYTLQNTVLKMAKKRAFIDGVLSISGASRIFSQDVKEEDDDPPIRDVTPPKVSEKTPEKGKQILSGLESKLS